MEFIIGKVGILGKDISENLNIAYDVLDASNMQFVKRFDLIKDAEQFVMDNEEIVLDFEDDFDEQLEDEPFSNCIERLSGTGEWDVIQCTTFETRDEAELFIETIYGDTGKYRASFRDDVFFMSEDETSFINEKSFAIKHLQLKFTRKYISFRQDLNNGLELSTKRIHEFAKIDSYLNSLEVELFVELLKLVSCGMDEYFNLV